MVSGKWVRDGIGFSVIMELAFARDSRCSD